MGYPSQTRSFRSGGSIRSRSTSELLLEAKDQASLFREGLLRTTRQAAQMTNLGLISSQWRVMERSEQGAKERSGTNPPEKLRKPYSDRA